MLSLVLLSASQYSASAQAQRAAPPEAFVPGQILVKFEPGTSGERILDVHQLLGGRLAQIIPRINV